MATSATYGVAKYGDSQYGRVLLAGDVGAYSITGGAASFLYNHVIQGDAGSYSITGVDAALLQSHVLSSSAGAYAITGGAASLFYNRFVAGDAGSYAMTGNSSTLIHNEVIYAGSWAFQITGYDAGLLKTYAITGDAGAYDMTGADAVLTYQPLQVVQTTGGLPPKKVKTQIKKNQREEVEAAVREAFDKMDGTYVPEPVVAKIQKEVKREIKKIDLGEYQVAMAQINALLLSAKLKIQEYESEIDDEVSVLMLL